MPPSRASQHSKTQKQLLISKLLDFRDNISPLTLVLDSLEQSARPLLREVLRRSRSTKTSTIFISFETLSPPKNVDHFVKAHSLDLDAIESNVRSTLQSSPTQKHLLLLDTTRPLLQLSANPTAYLTALLQPTGPTAALPALIAVHHADVPLPPHTRRPYQPSPLTLLRHIATAVLTLHAPRHVRAARYAAERAVAPPPVGLAEGEGVMQGLGANSAGAVVGEAEVRRRSGREVGVWFVLDWELATSAASSSEGKAARAAHRNAAGNNGKAEIVLFDDYSLFAQSGLEEEGMGIAEKRAGAPVDVSFELGLTEKQRRDREGVVLPYFDAQREDGTVGLGGRILYDMGIEDDFDEEEDEI